MIQMAPTFARHAAINRTTGEYGPSITDPSCYYDASTQRWFQVVLTLDRVGTTSELSGTNHLDIAVSQTANPTGAWNIYRLPVQNNGTQGTPDHGCSDGFCLGDYPHIGADAHAIFLTTNEFSLFGPGFYGAQIYAISKQALATGAKACFNSKMDREGEVCWMTRPVSVGHSMATVSDKGEKLTVTRVKYTPLKMPK